MPKGSKPKDSKQKTVKQVLPDEDIGLCSSSVQSCRSCASVSPKSDNDVEGCDMLQMRILELERELKIAKLTNELAREQSIKNAVDVHSEPSTSRQVVEPRSDHGREGASQPAIDLPKVELMPFYGESGSYWKFIKQFENFVENRVKDPGQRFLYLMHYCRGKAKEAIEECVMLPTDEAYKRARGILKELYGQPFLVARTLIDNMLAEAKRTKGDPEALSRLAVRMQSCQIALSQMNYEADLNALHTLEAVVKCLPLELQIRWADEAAIIETQGHEPVFDDLVTFLRGRMTVVRSRFGQIVAETQGTSGSGKKEPQKTTFTVERYRNGPFSGNRASVNIMNKSGSQFSDCKLCNGKHSLPECDRFLTSSVEERWDVAKRSGACFSCLECSHRSAACGKRTVCNVDGCKGRHHTLLHCERRTTNNEKENEARIVCSVSGHSEKPVRLGVFPVGVVTPKGVVRALAFIDNGSDTTLVRNDFARKHSLDGSPTSLCVTTVSGTCHHQSAMVRMQLVSLTQRETVDVPAAYTVKDLPMRAARSSLGISRCWDHLKDVPFEDYEGGDVDILIGCDVPEAHWVFEQRIGRHKQPYAIRTIFGWVLCGPLDKSVLREARVNCICHEQRTVETDFELLYNTEFGDLCDENKAMSCEDQEAHRMVSSGSKFIHGHFEVPLPWKEGLRKLPECRSTAQKRLQYLRNRLKRDPGLHLKYSAIMQHYLDLGYMEEAEPVSNESDLLWYLPHHSVMNPRKPDKIRVVFDCAAKSREVSLNDCLLQGPDLTTPLVEVLCRFRLQPIAVVADIEEMFLQVKVPPEHRNALRLLWWPEHNLEKPPTEYRLTVHPFGAVSSPFCANFALRETAKRFGDQFDVAVVKGVSEHFYVDDFLCSFEDSDSAISYIDQLVKLLAKGGFRLTKWLSNNRRVLQTLPEQERAPKVREISKSQLPLERTLGVQWDAESDDFIFAFTLLQKPTTRRGILSAVSSLFDPLGFVAPWLLPGKLLLQRLCRQRIGWDAPLKNEDADDWEQWVRGLIGLGDLRIQRCIRSVNVNDDAELHLFSDASEEGYGVAAYICWASSRGERECHLLFAKARVAPLKTVSIPRLELNAAVLSVKVSNLLTKCLHRLRLTSTFWTDSAIVLHYINNVRTRFATFVANRLTIIHETSSVTQWRYVKSEDNPADYCSRGLRDHKNKTHWLKGPKFLSMNKSNWPKTTIPGAPMEQIELKKTAMINVVSTSSTLVELLSRFSDWIKLLRSIAWLRRFVTYLVVMSSKTPGRSLRVGRISMRELQEAEFYILKLVQTQSFSAEMGQLHGEEKGKSVRRASSLWRLNPVMMDGLLRVGGRLSQSLLPVEQRHPIILPKKNNVTSLIVKYFHEMEGHSGPTHILTNIRKRFWIIHGATTVKNVISTCRLCRKRMVSAGRQLMAPLPAVRVQPGWRPFEQVGLDYFGPFEVKRGRSLEKRYACLITCLQSRAVHIEVAHSMSTDSFLLLLTRFIGRRGFPSDIYSDNGSNFIGANAELKHWTETLDQERINNRLLIKGIEWHFNPPYASHRGGVWERLIRSARRVLCMICSEQTPDDETLSTLFIEVERVLNNRPIVSLKSGDIDSASLTPNDLLLIRNSGGATLTDTLAERYRKRWKQVNYLADVFWKRWTAEYLPVLQRRQKWINKERNFQINDVVLLSSEHLKRNTWPLGIIVKCYPGEDGLVRAVDVKTRNGVFKRDIRQVCLLEESEAAVIDNSANQGEQTGGVVPNT